jgi:positive regulator of sigma E activity
MFVEHFRKDENDKNKISRNVFFTSSLIYIMMLTAFMVGWFMKLDTRDLSAVLISITTSYVTIASWYVKSTKDKEIEEIRVKSNAKF